MSGLKTITPVVLGVVASSAYSLYQCHVPLSSAEAETHLSHHLVMDTSEHLLWPRDVNPFQRGDW